MLIQLESAKSVRNPKRNMGCHWWDSHCSLGSKFCRIICSVVFQKWLCETGARFASSLPLRQQSEAVPQRSDPLPEIHFSQPSLGWGIQPKGAPPKTPRPLIKLKAIDANIKFHRWNRHKFSFGVGMTVTCKSRCNRLDCGHRNSERVPSFHFSSDCGVQGQVWFEWVLLSNTHQNGQIRRALCPKALAALTVRCMNPQYNPKGCVLLRLENGYHLYHKDLDPQLLLRLSWTPVLRVKFLDSIS